MYLFIMNLQENIQRIKEVMGLLIEEEQKNVSKIKCTLDFEVASGKLRRALLGRVRHCSNCRGRFSAVIISAFVKEEHDFKRW